MFILRRIRREYSQLSSYFHKIKASHLKMTRPPELTRDFIHDSLYNQNYGYFMKHVNIIHSEESFNAQDSLENDPILLTKNSMHRWKTSLLKIADYTDEEMYQDQVAKLYQIHGFNQDNMYHQLWHTPSTLLKPWYGKMIANYIIETWSANNNLSEPLVIYEIGPGSGCLASCIMGFIRDSYSNVYQHMSYNLIEISPRLMELQSSRLSEFNGKFRNFSSSILEWDKFESRNCVIIALEVLDNLPHDRVFISEDGTVLECKVLTNEDGSFGIGESIFKEIFEPMQDPLIIKYMKILQELKPKEVFKNNLNLFRRLSNALRYQFTSSGLIFQPFFDELHNSEFVPTGSLLFFQKLADYFPNHSLILSDFDSIETGDQSKGRNAPRVQSRYGGVSITADSYLVPRGMYDIFFQTDFDLASKLYSTIYKKPTLRTRILKHEEFSKKYSGDILATTTKNGYNPLLNDFKNVSFLLSN